MLFRFKRGVRVKVKVKDTYQSSRYFGGMSLNLMKHLSEIGVSYRVSMTYDSLRDTEIIKTNCYYFHPDDLELA